MRSAVLVSDASVRHERWPLMGIASLLLTTVLCLPSLLAGGTLIIELILSRDVTQ